MAPESFQDKTLQFTNHSPCIISNYELTDIIYTHHRWDMMRLDMFLYQSTDYNKVKRFIVTLMYHICKIVNRNILKSNLRGHITYIIVVNMQWK